MSKLSKHLYEFGPFQLDVEDRLLYDNGERVPLTPKVVETLVALVEGGGRIVTKDDLIKRVWPDTFVEDGNLTVNIFLLRKVLGQKLNGTACIETVPKRGYRFVVPVKQVTIDLEEDATKSSNPGEAGAIARNHAVPPQLPPQLIDAASEALPSPGFTVPPSKAHRSYTLIFASAGAVVAALAVCIGLNVGGLRERLFPGSGAPSIRSIAVLPLENLSGDAKQDPFADEMTDELITDLAKVDSLRVISRTSVMAYKGTHKPIGQIGRELNVDAIVEGSVVRSSSQVRITAQLIRVSTDQHLWAESYEREIQNIFGLQDEVARDITNRIQARLTNQEQRQLAHRPVNPEAYEAYLRGRYELTRQDPKAFKEAFAQFQRALEIDPLFPLAYAGLADTYDLFANYGVMKPEDAFPPAEAAATRSLQLDNSLAEAHASLGFAKIHFDWDWDGAEHEFKQAIALSPSYAIAHLRYAELLSTEGRHDEALKEVRIAQQLDPLSRAIGSNIGRILYHAHRFDEAIQALQGVLDVDPRSVYARQTLGMTYDAKGRFSDAERELTVVQESLKNGPLDSLAHVYALSGRAEKARAMMKLLGPENRTWFFNAGVYAALNEKNKAFDNLSKAYKNHDFFISFIKIHPYMDPLRSDPRYQDLLRRLNMPE